MIQHTDRTKKVWLVILGVVGGTCSFTVSADSIFQNSKHIDPFLGLEFSSVVSSDYGYDDNVFHQHQNHIVGSDYYALKPSISVIGHRNTKDFSFYYSGDYRKYNSGILSIQGQSDQSYSDHDFNGIFTWELGFRHHIELSANYGIGHESLGTGVTSGYYFYNNPSTRNEATFDGFKITRPIDKTNNKLAFKYTYGAKGAKGNIVFELSKEFLHYDVLNSYSPVFSSYLNDENVVETDANVMFRHQYTDRTRFDYRLIYKKYDYRDSQRDNNELITAISFISQITGKSKIEATIARLQKTTSGSDFSGINWSVSYKWQPMDYSTFVLLSKSEVKEPENTGDFVQYFENSITWNHQFLGRISSHLSYKNINNKYHIKDRNDTYHYVDLRLSYLFRPKIEIVFDYKYALYYSSLNTDPVIINENINSELTPVPYDRNLGYEQHQFSLSVKVAI